MKNAVTVAVTVIVFQTLSKYIAIASSAMALLLLPIFALNSLNLISVLGLEFKCATTRLFVTAGL